MELYYFPMEETAVQGLCGLEVSSTQVVSTAAN
jgi:hypothetical protein